LFTKSTGFITIVGIIDPRFTAVYLKEIAQHLPKPLRTNCLGALKVMRASQNPDAIDSTSFNIASQVPTTPLTLHQVYGTSSFASVEGEPFSPAELAAIFALSKAQATMQAGMSADHPGNIVS
jgi:hypothetical protein